VNLADLTRLSRNWHEYAAMFVALLGYQLLTDWSKGGSFENWHDWAIAVGVPAAVYAFRATLAAVNPDPAPQAIVPQVTPVAPEPQPVQPAPGTTPPPAA